MTNYIYIYIYIYMTTDTEVWKLTRILDHALLIL
jgi:hypothetical protein